jgi:predicted Rossmann-fold nucleotide-binding protein
VIAFPGGPGTMSEVAMALKIGRRTIGLKAWGDLPGILTASTPEMAVNLALSTT